MDQDLPNNLSPAGSQAICFRCGYELVGLASSGPCPECGYPIAESLAHKRLGLAAPEHLSALTLGASLSGVALGCWIVSGVTQSPIVAPLFAFGSQRLFAALDLPAAAMLCWGIWKLTIDDPNLDERHQSRANKRTMRIGAAGLLVIALLRFALGWKLATPIPGGVRSALPLVWGLLSLSLEMIATACWLMLATGMTNHTRWIAARLPDLVLFRMARSLGWVVAAAVIAGFVLWFPLGTAGRAASLPLLVFLAFAVRERLLRLRSA